MAKQHFYSRVPARGSLYNRSDGFDTFAHSQGLSRDFVERELSAVYENKLTKQDAEAVRTGKVTFPHTVVNKVTGLLLFLLPVTLKFIEPIYTLPIVCAVATVAAIHEGYYTEKNYDT